MHGFPEYRVNMDVRSMKFSPFKNVYIGKLAGVKGFWLGKLPVDMLTATVTKLQASIDDVLTVMSARRILDTIHNE